MVNKLNFTLSFWPDISDLLVNSYNFSMDNSIMSQSKRIGIITDKNPLVIKNNRPLSLLTVDYKIIAKTLANRLKKAIGSIIDGDQSGFIKGRYIGSNIRLIMDFIEYILMLNRSQLLC